MEPLFHESAYYIETYKICWSSGLYSPNGTPYLMSSKIILTVAHLQVLWSEFWSPRAQQTTQNTPFSIASGCGQRKKWAWPKNRARFARVLYTQNPPLQNLKSATVEHLQLAISQCPINILWVWLTGRLTLVIHYVRKCVGTEKGVRRRHVRHTED